MKVNRRNFLRQAAAAGILIGGAPLSSFGRIMTDEVRLTILHTNDVHSRMDPFPEGSGRNSGFGGVARRAKLIKEIRAKENNVLLLDAGDMLQGTPYFNLYHGEVEFAAMNAMKYDFATIGNHDFDAGIAQLATNSKKANFKLLNANYDFSNTPMNGLVEPYQIKNFDGVKVGVFGVGIKLHNLVPKDWYGDTVYTDPIASANVTATQLKEELNCDYVICLSHLGYDYDEPRESDVVLSQSTRHIDLILGGHTHTFLDIPDTRRNMDGQPVVISQVGWAGIKLGRFDVVFNRTSKKSKARCNHEWVRDLGKKSE